MNFQFLLSRLIPDADTCRAQAAALRQAHPDLPPRQLVEHAVKSAGRTAAATGAATGMASSPLTMVPAAFADMAAVLRIEGTLVGVIGALLDPDSLRDPQKLRADVISVVFPAAASQALRQMGIRAGERLSQAAVKKCATEDLLRTISRLASRYLGKHLTRDAIVGKAVPLVGMGIGAGWNWLEVKAIGRRAIRYYSHDPIGPKILPPLLPAKTRILRAVSRYLPGKNKSF